MVMKADSIGLVPGNDVGVKKVLWTNEGDYFDEAGDGGEGRVSEEGRLVFH